MDLLQPNSTFKKTFSVSPQGCSLRRQMKKQELMPWKQSDGTQMIMETSGSAKTRGEMDGETKDTLTFRLMRLEFLNKYTQGHQSGLASPKKEGQALTLRQGKQTATAPT